MSGLEIAGGVIAFIETAITILSRLRRTYERQKDLPGLLAKHINALIQIHSVIKVIRNEDTLQTSAVVAELGKMEMVAKELVTLVKQLSRRRSASGQFFHQLVRGSDDEKKLEKVMQDLSREQDQLALYIQVAHVGLTRTMSDKIAVEAEIVDRIDKLVQQVFGDGKGLQMMKFLRSRGYEDVAALPAMENESNPFDGSSLVQNNLTEDQAIQINGPIGGADWTEASRVRIESNKSVHGSIMVNHAMSMEAFQALLARRV
ncbi:hypothetical protein B0I35DRAFT_403215 [Stachybotrys elegans]|uniref:NACHT-NTPase and P-loop NTPases N-terminal domain-containing protein n=1 Tax=Stachybotrys elegans TaxID=80388 RepID=A0A8K0WVL9_9HYPO|nr:hypothetical protein B0I35DRAFT_403215 [Stachybotrys elegans]